MEHINNFIWDVISYIVISIIALIMGIIIPMRIKVYFYRFASIFHNLFSNGKIYNISGEWTAKYTNVKFVYKHGSHNIRLYQFRNRVVGGSINNKDGIIIDGKIVCENYFYGSFRDCKANGEYYGTFQVKIERETNIMRGLWVGYDCKGSDVISYGEWVWEPMKSLRPSNI